MCPDASTRRLCPGASTRGMLESMITNRDAFERTSEQERWDELARMTAADSIAIGEALLTSDLMRLAVFPDDDHPRSLARSLGIRSATVRTEALCDHGRE